MPGSHTLAGIRRHSAVAYQPLVLVDAMHLLAVMAARSVVTGWRRRIRLEET